MLVRSVNARRALYVVRVTVETDVIITSSEVSFQKIPVRVKRIESDDNEERVLNGLKLCQHIYRVPFSSRPLSRQRLTSAQSVEKSMYSPSCATSLDT